MWLNEGSECAVEPSFDGSCASSTSSSSAALVGIVWGLLSGGVLLSFFFLIFTVHFRKYRIVKMSSPNLNVVTLLGSGLTYSSAYLFGIERQNVWTRPSLEMLVQARICLLCVGGSLAFGPILGKSWRLYKVFTQQVPDKRVIIKDFQLLVMVAVLVLADILLLLIWIFLDPVQCLQSLNANLKVTENGLTCTMSRGYFCTSLYPALWLILFLGFKGSLLLFGAYLAGLTGDVSCPPVNQSLTLTVGITIVSLSTAIILAVNWFFHWWHDLVFGFTSGGIFVCTSALNCLIFIPQVRQWKAFEKQKDDISNMAKYFTSSSKNVHSTMYNDEEIYQLLGQKNSMMQLLVEKDTAIASLQEQMNNAKEKLMRLVAAEDNCNADDSPATLRFLQGHFAVACSSVAAENSPFSFSPGQELESRQNPELLNSQCSPGSFSKKDCIRYLECRSQESAPVEVAARCRLLNGSQDVADHSSANKEQRLSQCATTFGVDTLQEPLGQRLTTLNGKTEQPPPSAVTQKQLPGTSYVNSEKLQEILQELSMYHVKTQTSPRGRERDPDGEKCTQRQPQEIQGDRRNKLSPPKTRQEKKSPIHLPVMDRTASRFRRSSCALSEFPWAAASDPQDGGSLYSQPPVSSSALKKMPRYKSESSSEYSSHEGRGWLLDKHRGHPSSTRNLQPQQSNFWGLPALGSLPSQHFSLDSGSDSSSSEGAIHSRCCDVCHCSLSSSSVSCISGTDLEPSLALGYGVKHYGKPRLIVNFNEDLEPTYV